MKQLDIFGNLIDIETISEEEHKLKHQTIKQNFRNMYGLKKDDKCANCAHLYARYHNNRTYYKCKKIGLSNSKATDIRLKDTACNLFKESRDIE